MRNIHILATDKPSNLFEIDGHFIIETGQLIRPKNYRCIYITSDEEIKEGDWVITPDPQKPLEKVYKETYLPHYNKKKKIILTTDDQLIKNGVQPIPEDFLEYLVKNPSCEWVETYSLGIQNEETGESCHYKYETIIPKEEPYTNVQQKSLELNKQFVNSIDSESLENIMSEFDKQETLEEVAKESLKENFLPTEGDFAEGYILGSILGAKWQQEQDKKLYSEKDMEESFIKGALTDLRNTWGISDYDMAKEKFTEWFEQFKKK